MAKVTGKEEEGAEKIKDPLERVADLEAEALIAERMKQSSELLKELEAKRREKVKEDIEEFTATKKKAKESQRKVMTIAYLCGYCGQGFALSRFDGYRAPFFVGGRVGGDAAEGTSAEGETSKETQP